MQMGMMFMVMNIFNKQPPQQDLHGNMTDIANASDDPRLNGSKTLQLRNLYGISEECELFVHLGPGSHLSWTAVLNETAAAEEGAVLLWRSRVRYEDGENMTNNVTLPPFSSEVLRTGMQPPYLLASLLRVDLLEMSSTDLPKEHLLQGAIPVVARLKELDPDSQAGSLFGDGDLPEQQVQKTNSTKLPYFKSKLEIRPVYDHTVHPLQTLSQKPFSKMVAFPELGVYQPFLYVSDFWLLEKDYVPLNESLEGQRMEISLSFSAIKQWSWIMQMQMGDQWSTQDASEWSLTDTQRDAFMVKRLMIDTNPYLLAFGGAFIMLHLLFSLLAFKNDIQFWKNNESMRGLSARSMGVSFVCQVITALYLLDSQDTSKMILFQIFLDLGLAFWKLKKAVKLSLKSTFPFIYFEGQTGYDEGDTAKYDDEAVKYMSYILAPLFICYSIYSMLYNKHRSWYSYVVGSLAGGVYMFGFIMMTPQLYINYKLKSVEHLPWRALTYKAMNTFVDDVAALIIDMPMMHRLSCFRDDIIFFVYLYQRWAYRVDKSRPSMWVGDDGLTPSEREAKEKAAAESQAAPNASIDDVVAAANDAPGHAREAKTDADDAAAASLSDVPETPCQEDASDAATDDGVRQRR